MEKIIKFDTIYSDDYNFNIPKYNIMEYENLNTSTVLNSLIIA